MRMSYSNSIKLFLCLCMGILITYICMIKKSEFYRERVTKMTGPLAIGATTYHLTDTQRTESHAQIYAHPYQELMVKVWYPAEGPYFAKARMAGHREKRLWITRHMHYQTRQCQM